MLGKLIDGELITPTEMERRKIVITNPNKESLKYNMGYKDLIIDPEPQYDADAQCLIPSYEETDSTIMQHWKVEDIIPLSE